MDYWRSTPPINKPWFINPGLTLIHIDYSYSPSFATSQCLRISSCDIRVSPVFLGLEIPERAVEVSMGIYDKYINWWIEPTPLKNMTSSVGSMIPIYYGK